MRASQAPHTPRRMRHPGDLNQNCGVHHPPGLGPDVTTTRIKKPSIRSDIMDNQIRDTVISSQCVPGLGLCLQ